MDLNSRVIRRDNKQSVRSRLITNYALLASIQVDKVFREKCNTLHDTASNRDVVLTRQQKVTLYVTHALSFKRVHMVCAHSFCYSRYGVIHVYNNMAERLRSCYILLLLPAYYSTQLCMYSVLLIVLVLLVVLLVLGRTYYNSTRYIRTINSTSAFCFLCCHRARVIYILIQLVS